jgi:hypothetical protein
MIMYKLKYKDHILFSNRADINNNYDNNLLSSPSSWIFSELLNQIYLKKPLKRTINGLLLTGSKKNEE